MDQIDAILKLKNCYKELEEIDKDQVCGNINFAKSKIGEKIFKIAETLDVSSFIPKENKPNVPKPRGPIIHKIHNHPRWERSFDLVHDHVIIDREVYNQFLEKWDRIEKCL